MEATDSIAITEPDFTPGTWSRATPIISAGRPSATPCAARPASSQPNGSGRTVTTLPATMTARAHRMTARRRRPDPSRPSTGVAMAPASSVMVSVHCALLSGTR